MTKFPSCLLKSRSHIHHVAVEDNLPLALAYFSGYYRPSVKSTTYGWRCPEIALEPLGGRRKCLVYREEAGYRPGSSPAAGDCPSDDHLIAHILVNLSVVVSHWIGGQREYAVEESMNGKRPDALGGAGRAHHVHKEKEAVLDPRSVIAAKYDVAERSPSHKPTNM